MNVQSATLFAVLCTIVAFAAIIVGWFFVGPPSEARLVRLDAIRATNLASISGAITNYRLTHESLPQTLDELEKSAPNVSLSFKDPVGKAYEYAARDSFAYELCATFDRATETTTESAPLHSRFEKHGLGRQCFSLESQAPIAALIQRSAVNAVWIGVYRASPTSIKPHRSISIYEYAA